MEDLLCCDLNGCWRSVLHLCSQKRLKGERSEAGPVASQPKASARTTAFFPSCRAETAAMLEPILSGTPTCCCSELALQIQLSKGHRSRKTEPEVRHPAALLPRAKTPGAVPSNPRAVGHPQPEALAPGFVLNLWFLQHAHALSREGGWTRKLKSVTTMAAAASRGAPGRSQKTRFFSCFHSTMYDVMKQRPGWEESDECVQCACRASGVGARMLEAL